MPFNHINELPGSVKGVLPPQAQTIYQQAFNHAWEEYQNPSKRKSNDSRETVAHKVAWAAVEKKYYKNQNSGAWEPK